MKKKIMILIAIFAIITLGIVAWFYGYHNRKSLDNIPSKEIMVTYLQEKGEQYATEQLIGYHRDSLQYIWGESDIIFSGLWADGWNVDDNIGLVVFYDDDNKVEAVKLGENALEKDFNISLTWGISGQSSYDSKTGTLIKTTNATNPKDYITTLQLSEAEKTDLYNLIMKMDIEVYPEQYDPYNDPNAEIKITGSKPSSELILNIQTDTIDKTIECSCVLSFGEGKGYNDEAQAFLDLCEQLYAIIISSEEWKYLPEYEILYE